jgi:hypothetical protein
MQKLFLLLLFLSLTTALIAQAEDVATGLGRPYELLLFEDDLIISEITNDRISRIDLSDPAYPRTTLISGIDNPLGMAQKDNKLYVVGRNDSIIYKVSLTSPLPGLSRVIKLNEKPLGVAIHGDDMYVGTLFTHKIYRVDLTDGIPVAVDLGFAGLGQPGFMVTHGDFVYFSDVDDDVVMRFDATLAAPVLETVATGIDSPAGMFFEGDYLYVNGYLSQAVFRIDVSGGFASPAIEVLELDNPRGLIMYDGEFFSALYVENKIVKGSFAVLPVTWESFSASPVADKSVRLDWSVSAMEDHDYFSVERSGDGINWRTLPVDVYESEGAAAGATKAFRSNDPSPLAGDSYYRIRQHDLDGASSQTEVATISIGRSTIGVYPNPVGSDGTLTVSGLVEGELVRLFSSTGQLARQFVGAPRYKLEGLAPGVYVLLAGERGVRVVVR